MSKWAVMGFDSLFEPASSGHLSNCSFGLDFGLHYYMDCAVS